eukprot:2191948-Alexandrium_andersonii.AAC.1
MAAGTAAQLDEVGVQASPKARPVFTGASSPRVAQCEWGPRTLGAWRARGLRGDRAALLARLGPQPRPAGRWRPTRFLSW